LNRLRFPIRARAAGADRGKWRRIVAVAGGLLFVAVAAAWAHNIGVTRGTAIAAASARARAAVAEARAADAARWAPRELETAERALHEAMTAQRADQVSWWPLPDAKTVGAAFDAASAAGATALGVARDRRAAAAAAATAQLDEASRAVSASETLANTIHLGTRREIVARARTTLVEAQVYVREGAFESATTRAREARDLAWTARDEAADIAARYAEAANIARWQRWKSDIIAWSRREGRPAVFVNKEAHLVTLYVRGEAVKTYKADLGFNWIADKFREGDGATPEGRYRVVSRMANLPSEFYKALLIDYPNADDRAKFSRARREGAVPPAARIGGLIEIHGSGGRNQDWTNGCVALANPDMDDLFARVGVGTPVTIVGSDDYGSLAEFSARQRRTPDGQRP
jgi:lipoprotein-anchoring transpeptidase ErfK/SrfK